MKMQAKDQSVSFRLVVQVAREYTRDRKKRESVQNPRTKGTQLPKTKKKKQKRKEKVGM